MGTTARAGLPFPEPTDPIADGATAIEALANAIDTNLVYGSVVPWDTLTPEAVPPGKIEIETGSALFTVGASGWGSFNFNHTFSRPPTVIGICGDNAYGFVTYAHRASSVAGWAFVIIRYDATFPVNGSTHRCNYIAIAPM